MAQSHQSFKKLSQDTARTIQKINCKSTYKLEDADAKKIFAQVKKIADFPDNKLIREKVVALDKITNLYSDKLKQFLTNDHPKIFAELTILEIDALLKLMNAWGRYNEEIILLITSRCLFVKSLKTQDIQIINRMDDHIKHMNEIKKAHEPKRLSTVSKCIDDKDIKTILSTVPTPTSPEECEILLKSVLKTLRKYDIPSAVLELKALSKSPSLQQYYKASTDTSVMLFEKLTERYKDIIKNNSTHKTEIEEKLSVIIIFIQIYDILSKDNYKELATLATFHSHRGMLCGIQGKSDLAEKAKKISEAIADQYKKEDKQFLENHKKLIAEIEESVSNINESNIDPFIKKLQSQYEDKLIPIDILYDYSLAAYWNAGIASTETLKYYNHLIKKEYELINQNDLHERHKLGKLLLYRAKIYEKNGYYDEAIRDLNKILIDQKFDEQMRAQAKPLQKWLLDKCIEESIQNPDISHQDRIIQLENLFSFAKNLKNETFLKRYEEYSKLIINRYFMQHDKAIEYYHLCSKYNLDKNITAIPLLHRGLCYLHSSDDKKGMKDLKAAIDILINNKNNYREEDIRFVYTELRKVMLKKHDFATQLIKTLKEYFPMPKKLEVDFYHSHATKLMKSNDLLEAKKVFEQALSLTTPEEEIYHKTQECLQKIVERLKEKENKYIQLLEEQEVETDPKRSSKPIPRKVAQKPKKQKKIKEKNTEKKPPTQEDSKWNSLKVNVTTILSEAKKIAGEDKISNNHYYDIIKRINNIEHEPTLEKIPEKNHRHSKLKKKIYKSLNKAKKILEPIPDKIQEKIVAEKKSLDDFAIQKTEENLKAVINENKQNQDSLEKKDAGIQKIKILLEKTRINLQNALSTYYSAKKLGNKDLITRTTNARKIANQTHQKAKKLLEKNEKERAKQNRNVKPKLNIINDKKEVLSVPASIDNTPPNGARAFQTFFIKTAFPSSGNNSRTIAELEIGLKKGEAFTFATELEWIHALQKELAKYKCSLIMRSSVNALAIQQYVRPDKPLSSSQIKDIDFYIPYDKEGVESGNIKKILQNFGFTITDDLPNPYHQNFVCHRKRADGSRMSYEITLRTSPEYVSTNLSDLKNSEIILSEEKIASGDNDVLHIPLKNGLYANVYHYQGIKKIFEEDCFETRLPDLSDPDMHLHEFFARTFKDCKFAQRELGISKIGPNASKALFDPDYIKEFFSRRYDNMYLKKSCYLEIIGLIRDKCFPEAKLHLQAFLMEVLEFHLKLNDISLGEDDICKKTIIEHMSNFIQSLFVNSSENNKNELTEKFYYAVKFCMDEVNTFSNNKIICSKKRFSDLVSARLIKYSIDTEQEYRAQFTQFLQENFNKTEEKQQASPLNGLSIFTNTTDIANDAALAAKLQEAEFSNQTIESTNKYPFYSSNNAFCYFSSNTLDEKKFSPSNILPCNDDESFALAVQDAEYSPTTQESSSASSSSSSSNSTMSSTRETTNIVVSR